MKEENETICLDLPALKEKCRKLEEEVSEAKRKTEICLIFKQTDPSVQNMRGLVNKISGFPKFELDTKLTAS